MRYATVIIIIFVLALLFEFQMLSYNANDRREKCKIVITQSGALHKATPYEYYACLNK